MLRTVLKSLSWLYIGYVLLVVIVFTPLVNLLADRAASDALGRPFSTGVILLDPFTMSLSVQKLQVGDAEGARFVELEYGHVDVAVFRSIFRSEVALESLSLDGLSAQLLKRADGTLSIDDLLQTDPEQDNTDAPPTVSVGLIDIGITTLGFRDESVTPAFSNALTDGALQIRGLTTAEGKDDGELELNFEMDSGGRVNAVAAFNVPKLTVSGNANVESFALPSWWQYVMSDTNGQLASGIYDGNFSADLALTDGITGELVLSEQRLSAIDLRPIKSYREATGITLKEFFIDSTSIEPGKRSVQIGKTTIDTLEVSTLLEGSQVSLLELLLPSSETTAAASPPRDPQQAPETQVTDDADSDPEAWSITSEGVAITDSAVHIASDLFRGGALDITALEFSKGASSWPAPLSSPYSLSLTLAEQSRLKVIGEGVFNTGELQAAISIEALPLPLFEPLFSDDYDISLVTGEAILYADASFVDFLPDTLSGRLEIDNLLAHMPGTDTQLLRFRQLRIEEIVLDAFAKSLVLGVIHLTSAESSLVLLEDGTLNTSRIAKLSNQVAEGAEEYANQKADQAVDDDKGWRIQIPTVQIYESRLAFRDESLIVKFTAPIEDLYAEITGFDTATDSSVSVTATGVIDGFAPVDVNGKLGHFSDPEDGELTLTMRGVDLARLTPYSATYAGYPIERGVMSVTLDYTLVSGGVRGSNHVIVEQLKLGEKDPDVEGSGIPIKTAIALLTNVAGVIDITLPVSGNIEDPSFGIGSAVAQALGTLMTNVIAAPFKLLASLGGKKDVPDKVRFAAGSAVLSPESKENLEAITKGLLQRPNLIVELAPAINDAIDREVLARKALENELLASGLLAEDITTRSIEWENAVRLIAAERGLDPALSVSEQIKGLISQQPLPEGALAALASDRAAAVKTHMVAVDGFDPQRAVIDNWRSSQDQFAGVSLSVAPR